MSELIDLCQKLVRFPSITGKTDEIFLFLKDFFNQNGFDTHLESFSAPNKKESSCLCASIGSGHPHLLFAGHVDVVNAEHASDWKYPPFDATIKNETLYGRGIADMKGSVACFVHACKEFISQQQFSGKITILLSGDEEEPIVEGTHQMLKVLHQKGEIFDFALVGEPSNPKTMGDEIKVGRRGDIVFHITSLGKAGHTAYAESKTNPVHNLIELLHSLKADNLDNGNAYFAPSSIHITTFDVGNGATNVVPSTAHTSIDIRFNSEHTYNSIEKWLNTHIQNTFGTFEVKTEYIGEPFLSPINENINILKKLIKKHTGNEPSYSTAGGTSDARFIKDYCPVVEYGLTNSSIHKTDEHESLQNIEILYKVYQDFLAEFFK